MYSVGIDVGGTFTDFVAIDVNGEMFTAKVPTTPKDQSIAVLMGLENLANQLNLELRDFIKNCEYIVHGTTVAANTMLEMNGARTGIITTKGFRDILDIRRNYKETAFDLRFPAPFPIAPRRNRIPVTERVDYSGKIIETLNEDEVREAVTKLGLNVDSVAVCYLFSFLNPTHEIRTREIIREINPDLHISLSHEILPRVREFERLSTTVVDAFVTPKLTSYLNTLKSRLYEERFSGEIFIMSANGGMLPINQAAKSGAKLVLSGPAGGVVAGAQVGKETGSGDVITVDMGGTSYDVCLIKNGTPSISTDAWINRYRVAVPALDIHTIGAGGGSIASVDEGGKLTVGPASAGAIPGPACFGKGGKFPTVTDANLYLGLLGVNSFLGGNMRLDYEASARAIEEYVAKPMGISTTEAAAGIFRVINNSMNNEIIRVSISKGYDHRDFDLIAFGGAGAIHAARQAKELGIRKVIIPKGNASVLCALGDVMSDVLISKTRGFYSRTSTVDCELLNKQILDAINEGKQELRDIQSLEDLEITVFLEMHYIGQSHEIMIEAILNDDGLMDDFSLAKTLLKFHETHEQMYSFNKPEEEMEIIGIQIDILGLRTKPLVLSDEVADINTIESLKEMRKVYFEEFRDFVDTPVYDGQSMLPGYKITGPAIIEEPNTTITVIPDSYVVITADRMYEMIFEHRE